jgi:hypothetical protein
MPEGDGADFYRAAVAQRKELAQHFLFMTGDTANEEAWRVLEGTRARPCWRSLSTRWSR